MKNDSKSKVVMGSNTTSVNPNATMTRTFAVTCNSGNRTPLPTYSESCMTSFVRSALLRLRKNS